MIRSPKVVVLVVLLLVVGGVAGWYSWQPGSPAAIPEVAVESLHPNVASAIQAAQQAVRDQPYSGTAWGELGMVLLAHEFREPARLCLTEAERLAPQDFRWPYFHGYSMEDTDFQQALTDYEKARQLRPDYVPLLLREALIDMRLGNLEACQKMLVQAVEQDPGNPNVLVITGQYSLLAGDRERAEDCFQRAAQIPKWLPTPAYLELVKLTAQRGDFQAAYRYQQQLAGYPEVARMEIQDSVLGELRKYEGLSKELAEQADFALARGDLATAVTSYEAFLKQRPDLSTAHSNLAWAYFLSGRTQDAIQRYEYVLKQFGPVIPAYFGLAKIYEKSGDLERSNQYLEEILKRKPDDEQAWFMRGLLQERNNQADQAIVSYRAATEADPTFPQAHLALGVALLHQKRFDESRIHLEQAAQLVPDDPIPRQYLKQLLDLTAEEAKPSIAP